jgi:hypothetical protein
MAMKASEIDKGLKVQDPSNPDDEDKTYYIPPSRVPVYKAYEQVAPDKFERINQDRVWNWWLTLVTAGPVSKQEIQIRIPQVYRTRDSATGKEYLFYNVDLSGKDWKGNRKDFSALEGVVEGMPSFEYDRDIMTNKPIPGTTQVLDVKREYTIPFTKDAVEKITPFFRNPLSCIIVDQTNGRKYSCSLSEFKDMSYDELINLKNGYTEFMINRRRSQLKEGGVK